VIQVVYGFGDASAGKGFGSTVQGFPVGSFTPISADNPVNWRVGIWGPDIESESSNYRELANLVLTVEEEAAAGKTTPQQKVHSTKGPLRLRNSMLWFFG
jgi:hypothetical protein